MDGIPQVRITLDHMRQQLIHQFAAHTEGMQRAFDQAVTEALDAFDYQAEVRRLVNVEVGEHLRVAVRSAFYDPEVQAAIYTAIAKRAKQEQRSR